MPPEVTSASVAVGLLVMGVALAIAYAVWNWRR